MASACVSCCWVPLVGFSCWLLSFSTSEFLFMISHLLLIFSTWWDLILKLSFSFLGIGSFLLLLGPIKSLCLQSPTWASLGTVSLCLLFPWMGHSLLPPCKTHTFVVVENGFHEHYNVIPLETRVSAFPGVILYCSSRQASSSVFCWLSEWRFCVCCLSFMAIEGSSQLT